MVVLLRQHRRVEAERAERDELGARVELLGPAGAAQQLDKPAGGAGAHLGHLDLDAVGALEQELDRGDRVDLTRVTLPLSARSEVMRCSAIRGSASWPPTRAATARPRKAKAARSIVG